MFLFSQCALALLGLASCSSALHLTAGRSKRIQQQNSLQPVGNLNEASTDESSRDWVKLSSVPGHVTTQVGANIELECEAIGSPPPSIIWLRDGRQVDESDSGEENRVPDWPSNGGALAKVVSRFLLPCVSPREAGAVFTCLASSGERSTLASSALRVLQPSDENISEECLGKSAQSPRITLHNPAVLQLMGRDVMLMCEVEAAPKPSVHWLGPSGQQALGPRFKVLESGALIISRLSWADMGEYTCVAENSIGQDTTSTFLYPLLNEEM